jgi:hypothetical protein
MPQYRVYDPTAKVAITDDIKKAYPRFANVADGQMLPIQGFYRDYNQKQSDRFAKSFGNQLEQDFNDAGIPVKAGTFNSVLPQLTKYSAAIAGQEPDQIPGALLKAGASQSLVNQLTNLYPQGYKAQTFVNARETEKKKADAIAGKAPVDQAKIQTLPALAASLGLSPAQTKVALSRVPGTVDEYDAVVKAMQDQANKNREFSAANPTPGPASNLVGDDYLKTLSPGLQSQIKGYGEGRLLLSALPRGKEKTALVNTLTQAYPDFDQSKGETWGKTRNEYMGSGTTAKKVVSYNTALEHMADLYDHSTYEGIYIPGSKDYSDRSVALNYVANEVGTAIKTGVMSQKEGDEILGSLKGWTPSTAKERTAETARLLNDKIDEYQRKFQEAAPTQHIQAPTLLSSKASASYNHVVNGAPLQTQTSHVVPAGAIPGRDAQGNIVGYKTADGKVTKF